MGPSTFIDGVAEPTWPARVAQPYFNGAVDVHRRSATTPTRSASRWRHFNGAVDVHRRSASCPSSLACRRRYFNGAVDVHRRSGDRVRALARRRTATSMGPSTFIDGVGLRCIRLYLHRVTSMGPSTFIDGVTSASSGRTRSSSLQWGRRRSSTECLPPVRALSAAGTLQWGRRRSSTEWRPTWPGTASTARNFNGAVDVHRRSDGCGFVHAHDHANFNGAVDVHRRSDRQAQRQHGSVRVTSLGPSTFIDGVA